MSYALATTQKLVRWYVFDRKAPTLREFSIIDRLDLDIVPILVDKASAKRTALALGLPTWRYVRLSG